MVQCHKCNEWTDSEMYWTSNPLEKFCRRCSGVNLRDNIISSPAHYTSGSIETIEVIEDWGLGYHLGNAVKYISRAGKKDPDKKVEDLRKAVWYLEREITNEEKDNG